MADVMETARHHVEQEAGNFVRGKRHCLLPVGAAATIVLIAEGDLGRVGGDEPARFREGMARPNSPGENVSRNPEAVRTATSFLLRLEVDPNE